MNRPLAPLLVLAIALLPRDAEGQNGKAKDAPSQAAPDRVEPPDKPALPKEIEPFTPPLPGGKVSPDGPALAEWTRSADPGDIVVVTGYKLTALQGKEAGQDAEVIVAASGSPMKAEIVRACEQGMAVRLPPALPPNAMFLLWVRNSSGLSRPAVINRTDAWWLGPDKAARGATVGVYGRNLVKNPAASEASKKTFSGTWIYLKPPAGGGVWAKAVAGNPYKVDFVVPANFPNGTYDAWVHNGRGGAYGWSGPLKLTVDEGPGWTQAAVNVKEHGAAGNGSTDDTAAIRKALGAARRLERGSLLFPPGTYMISKGFEASSNLRWMGAGKDKTVLRAARGFPPGESLLGGGNVKNFEVRDLALEAGTEPKRTTSAVNIRGSTDLRFTNVRIHNPTSGGFDVQGDRHVFFQGSDIISNGSFIGAASQVFVDGCTFQAAYDANSLFASWGGSCISVTNTTAKDFDNSTPTGWGEGRFFVCMAHWGANRFQYFGNNTTVDLCVREGYGNQNAGEQYLWEIGSKWQGKPAGATPTTATFGAGTPSLAGQEAVIAKGKGLGQNRRVTAFDAATGTITVDPPWNVPPDPSSLVVAGGFADRVVLYRNTIDGKPRGVSSPTHIASAGIQPYGGMFNLVADSNTCHEVRCGIANWGMVGNGLAIPHYFSLYVNNRIEKSRSGLVNILGIWDAPREPGATLLLGTNFRRNMFVEVGSTVDVSRGKGDPASMVLNVYDRNVSGNSPLPARVD